jgi:hypothetical protein
MNCLVREEASYVGRCHHCISSFDGYCSIYMDYGELRKHIENYFTLQFSCQLVNKLVCYEQCAKH